MVARPASSVTLWMMVSLLVASSVCVAQGFDFHTHDPLKAFVYVEYPLGSDYFIHGNEDTSLFRCILTKEKGGVDGVAYSEISIWGNRIGPWEIFRNEKDRGFAYIGTRILTDTACLESCRSEEYLKTGRCPWRKGWPKN